MKSPPLILDFFEIDFRRRIERTAQSSGKVQSQTRGRGNWNALIRRIDPLVRNDDRYVLGIEHRARRTWGGDEAIGGRHRSYRVTGIGGCWRHRRATGTRGRDALQVQYRPHVLSDTRSNRRGDGETNRVDQYRASGAGDELPNILGSVGDGHVRERGSVNQAISGHKLLLRLAACCGGCDIEII